MLILIRKLLYILQNSFQPEIQIVKMNRRNLKLILFIAISAITVVGFSMILSSPRFFEMRDIEEKTNMTTEAVEIETTKNPTTTLSTAALTTEVVGPCPRKCQSNNCVTIVGDSPFSPTKNKRMAEINATAEFRISVQVYFPDLVSFHRTNIIHFWI